MSPSSQPTRDAIGTLKPWNIEARPLTQKAVHVTWDAEENRETDGEGSDQRRYFTVYRAQGEKKEAPASDAYEKVAENLTVTRFLDRRVTKDTTYWYTITTKDENGNETERTEPVSATPREPPQLIGATYHRPGGNSSQQENLFSDGSRWLTETDSHASISGNFWVLVTFDRRMDPGIGNENRYVLRAAARIGGVSPVSAIRDRMGRRALLAFDTESLLEHFGQSLTEATDHYEITVSNVVDIDENPIRASTQPLEIPRDAVGTAVSDLTQVRVYPNPVRPHVADKGAITFDRLPAGTRIQLFNAGGELLETLDVTDHDHNRKEWWLTSNNTADVSTGIYIYVLEFDDRKKDRQNRGDKMNNFILIANPISGKGHAKSIAEQAYTALTESGAHGQLIFTSAPGDAKRFAQEATSDGIRSVIACGGDGTLHEVVNGIAMVPGVTLGVLPCGRGNDFAAAIGVPLKPEAAIATLLSGTPIHVDLGRCYNSHQPSAASSVGASSTRKILL